MSGSQALSILLPESPLTLPCTPIPVTLARLWVLRSLTGPPHLRPHWWVPCPDPLGASHIVHACPPTGRKCWRSDGPPCFSGPPWSCGGQLVYKCPSSFPVGRITEAHGLHESLGPQWNEAPFLHCSHWLEKGVLLGFLPSWTPTTPLLGFPVIVFPPINFPMTF